MDRGYQINMDRWYQKKDIYDLQLVTILIYPLFMYIGYFINNS